MTDKRFVLLDNGLITDNGLNIMLDGGLDCEDMVELLNELADENEQLKKEVRKWKNRFVDAETSLIYEYSTNIDEDLKELAEIIND